MTARVLDFSEWERLPEELDPILMKLSPGTSRVCVIENEEGVIVAHWLLMPVLHAECLYIAPGHRGRVSVGRRLLALMQQTARSLGWDRVSTASMSEDVTRMLLKIGAEAYPPALHFSLPIGHGDVCLKK